MKLINIDFDSYSLLNSELNEYVVICNNHNYIPTKEDFKEIVDFLLLFHSGSTTLCESVDESVIDNLYETQINAGGGVGWDAAGDFDKAVDTVNKLAAGSIAAVATGAVGVGMYVNYLFKKTKVMISSAKEKKILSKRIKNYKKLYDLKIKKWELEGSEGEPPQMDIPPLS
jgi:hypothetical protein